MIRERALKGAIGINPPGQPLPANGGALGQRGNNDQQTGPDDPRYLHLARRLPAHRRPQPAPASQHDPFRWLVNACS